MINIATLTKGQVLTSDDLWFDVIDNGIFVDPYYITYTIYVKTGCCEEPLLETVDSVPVRYGTGKYFAAWQMPADIQIGDYSIKWKVGLTSGSPILETSSDFFVTVKSYLSSDATGQMPHRHFTGMGDC